MGVLVHGFLYSVVVAVQSVVKPAPPGPTEDHGQHTSYSESSNLSWVPLSQYKSPLSSASASQSQSASVPPSPPPPPPSPPPYSSSSRASNSALSSSSWYSASAAAPPAAGPPAPSSPPSPPGHLGLAC